VDFIKPIVAGLLVAASPAMAAGPAVATASPQPAPYVAEQSGFGVVQVATLDAARLLAQWNQSTGDVSLTTDSATVRNVPIDTYLLFKGCTAAQDGNCYVTTEYWAYDPAGKLYGYAKGISIWKSPKPTGRAFALGDNKVILRVENGERLGAYTMRFRTTDEVAAVTVQTEAVLNVAEARKSN
jgi:hypothetical protein